MRRLCLLISRCGGNRTAATTPPKIICIFCVGRGDIVKCLGVLWLMFRGNVADCCAANILR